MHFSGEELNQSIPFANETQTRPENAKLLIYSCTVEAAHSVSEGRKGGGVMDHLPWLLCAIYRGGSRGNCPSLSLVNKH